MMKSLGVSSNLQSLPMKRKSGFDRESSDDLYLHLQSTTYYDFRNSPNYVTYHKPTTADRFTYSHKPQLSFNFIAGTMLSWRVANTLPRTVIPSTIPSYSDENMSFRIFKVHVKAVVHQKTCRSCIGLYA